VQPDRGWPGDRAALPGVEPRRHQALFGGWLSRHGQVDAGQQLLPLSVRPAPDAEGAARYPAGKGLAAADHLMLRGQRPAHQLTVKYGALGHNYIMSPIMRYG
jgi:hypothetical protein